MNKKYYTTKEISEKFSVTIETINSWRRHGKLPCYKHGPRKYYYSDEHLEEYIKGK